MSEKTHIIVNLLISTAIGLLIGLIEHAMPNLTTKNLILVSLSGLLGASIGISIRNFFVFAYTRLSRFTLYLISSLIILTYVSLFIIGRNMILGGEFLELKNLLIIIFAEIFGLIWTVVSCRLTDKMNDKLRDVQKEYALK